MVGKTLGKYELVAFLARGDTSVVYEGYQPDEERRVTVKLLTPARSREETAVSQFRQDAERMAQLDHPHILPIYDHGEQDGVHYIVSRFVAGGTVYDHRRRYRPLPVAQKLLRPITEALAYAHGRDVIHGNLDPANILLDGEKRPLLTDFSPHHQPGSSRALLSPEQALGGVIDPRTDVYGLGALLYQLLVGEAPPAGSIPSPRLKRPDLSEEVEELILKAMAQDPDNRFQTVTDFMQALDDASQPTSDDAPTPTPAPNPASEEKKADPFVQWSLFLIIAIILLIGTYFLFYRGGGDQSGVPTPAPNAPVLTAITRLNIRSGPGESYEIIGMMEEGQSAEIIGVSPNFQWWVIRFPAAADGQGWASAQFSAAGNTLNVSVVQPPPLPAATPSTNVTPIFPTAIPATDVSPTDTPP